MHGPLERCCDEALRCLLGSVRSNRRGVFFISQALPNNRRVMFWHKKDGWLWVAGGVVALGLLTTLSFYNWRLVQTTQRAVRQAELSADTLRVLFSTLQDAETGQRGYLLTGADRYLEPYTQAVLHLDPLLHSLLQNTNATQQASLQRLTNLSHAKLAELQDTIDRRQAGDPVGALAIVKTDRG